MTITEDSPSTPYVIPGMTGIHWTVFNAVLSEVPSPSIAIAVNLANTIATSLRDYFEAEPAELLSDLKGDATLPSRPRSEAWRVANAATTTAYTRALQRETRAAADRHYHEWETWEVELAEDRNIRARDVAQRTGRSLAAVTSKRRKMKEEARHEALHGV